jgi:hypothetical protein
MTDAELDELEYNLRDGNIATRWLTGAADAIAHLRARLAAACQSAEDYRVLACKEQDRAEQERYAKRRLSELYRGFRARVRELETRRCSTCRWHCKDGFCCDLEHGMPDEATCNAWEAKQ